MKASIIRTGEQSPYVRLRILETGARFRLRTNGRNKAKGFGTPGVDEEMRPEGGLRPKKYMNGSLESSLYIKLDPLARQRER